MHFLSYRLRWQKYTLIFKNQKESIIYTDTLLVIVLHRNTHNTNYKSIGIY